MNQRVDLQCALTLMSPLHVGTGLGIAGTIDGVVTRDGNGNPVIPGSSLKGRLRHHFRQARALLYPSTPLHPPGTLCGPGVVVPCAECAVFGAPAHPARFHFSDARPLLSPQAAGLLSGVGDNLRTGIAMSRRRGVVMERLLYTIEVIPPRIVFQAAVSGCVDAPDYLQALETPEVVGLLLALCLFESVGRGKSAGLGKLSVVPRRVSVGGHPVIDSLDAMKAHLERVVTGGSRSAMP